MVTDYDEEATIKDIQKRLMENLHASEERIWYSFLTEDDKRKE